MSPERVSRHTHLSACATSAMVVAMVGGAVLGGERAPVTIVRVRPSKVLYLVGEQATADVVLENHTQAEVKGKLDLREEWDLAESRGVWSGEVTLAPGQQKKVAVKWNVGQVQYGRAVRATFSVGGKPVARAAEFVQVATVQTWWRMNMLNGGGWYERDRVKTDPFVTYTNFDNHFAYALSPFSNLATDLEEYRAGQSRYRVRTQDLIARIKRRQAMGIRAGAYTISAIGGPGGYEMARQHPEWFLRDARGAFNTCAMPISPLELSYSPERSMSGWYALAPDFSNPEVTQYGGEEIVRAIRQFGWDAVFFDGAYGINYGAFYTDKNIYYWTGKSLPSGEAADKISAEVVRKTREIVRKTYPHVVFWYNGANPKRKSVRLQQLAALDDPYGGSLFELQGCQVLNPNHHGHHWRNLFDIYVSERDALLAEPRLDDPVLNTGYMYNLSVWVTMPKDEYAASRDTWTMASHIGAFLIAARIHPCVLCSSGFRPSLQFMTRYSSLLWPKSVKHVKKPWGLVSVESNRELWWEDGVYVKDTADHRDVVVHLVNSPDQEAIDPKVGRDPAPAKFVEVEVKVTGDPAKAQVWALQTYGYDSAVNEPVQVRLKTEIDGRTVIVEVPPFHYHTLVVVRQPKGK